MNFACCLFKYQPYGGMEQDLLRIIAVCKERGHKVDVFTISWEGPIPAGITIKIIPVRAFTNHGRAVGFVKKLTPILVTAKYDMVIGFNKMPGLDIYYAADVCYGWKAHKRHSWWYRLTRRYRVYSRFERAVFNPAAKTHILYLAEMVKQQYINHYQTLAERFHQLTPGLPVLLRPQQNCFQQRVQARHKHDLAADDQLLLFVGHNFKLKGLDRVLRAISALPRGVQNRVKLRVVGVGDIAAYSKLAKKLNIFQKVRFLGLSNNVFELLLAADLLLHPARFEAAGLVLVEALAAGTAVLTTASCGYASYITVAEAGAVMPEPFNQAEFNNRLQQSLTPEVLTNWCNNALKYAQTANIYGRQDVVDIIENICNKT